jgi:predicted transcriptional regulator
LQRSRASIKTTSSFIFVSPETMEVVDVVQRRWGVLRTLRAGPKSKPELVDSCGVSRSTVDRAIDEITEARLCVREYGSGYRLTPNGRIVVGLFTAVGRGISGVRRATAKGVQFDVDDAGVGALFADAEIVTGEPYAPDRPLRAVSDWLRRADRLRGFTPAVVNEYVEICSDRLDRGTLELDLVITPEVSEFLFAEYTEEYGRDLDSDRAHFRTASLASSIGLALFEEGDDVTAALLSYGDGGLRGIAQTESRLGVAWAERRFEELGAASAPVLTRRAV